MAFIIKDRIKEGTTTTGTGDITLGGSPVTFESFQSYMTNGDTTYYAIVHTASGVDEWEVGLGTWNTGNTLTRTTVLAGSSGTSAVNFSTGTKDIFMTYPAAHAALAGDDVTFDNITVTGTVDGRDVAADGTKLDTVEQNADVTDAVNVAAAGALMKSGGTMTGALILNADPTTALGAATKEYVDTIAAAGIHYHTPVRVEAPSALTATYDNGTSGVGATLTNSGTQAALVIDGVTLSTSDRVLVYNQTNAAHNGVYTVTNTGSASTNWVLTRATDADSYGASDPDALGEGDAYFVKEGDTGAGELYVMNTAGTITFGTTAITFTVIAETAVYSAGTGLTLTGTTFSIGQDVATTANVTFNQVTAAIIGNVTGNVTGDVSGNAGTATKLATARTVQLSGDVTGSASFDGSANINITAAVTDDSHAHVISNVDGLQTALDGKVPTSRTITAGNGLTGGGDLTANRTINVGAGSGITVNADDVAIDSSYTGFDGRYYTETEADSRFVNVTGDTMSGQLVVDDGNANPLELKRSSQVGIEFNDTSVGSRYLGVSGGNLWFGSNLNHGINQKVFTDAYHPNADKWTTARTNTVTLSGDVTGTGSASVDGTGNWTVSITADWRGGTADTTVNMNDNSISNVNRLNFINHEGDDQTAVAGDVIFDENFYNDTEYGSTSIWPGGDGGGLAVYNQDGWGRILTDRNMKWANGNFAGMTIGTSSAAPHNAGGLQISNTTNNEKIVMSGSADPYIRWQEGTTDRFYIQWTSGNNSPLIRNQESTYFDFRGNSGVQMRLMDNGGTTRGSVHANTSNNVGFLDAGGSWAVRHINDSGTYFYTDGATEEFKVGRDIVSGDYGTVEVRTNKGGWGGYSIYGNWVFMSEGAATSGIYNDTNNEWAAVFRQNAEVELYYNGSLAMETVGANGIRVGSTTSSDIYMQDTDHGERRIHCNSNQLGFLDSSSQWSFWSNDSGYINSVRGANFGAATLTADGQNDVFMFASGPTSGVAQAGAFHNKLRILGGSGQSRDLQLYQQDSEYAHIGSSWTGNQLTIDSAFTQVNCNTDIGVGSGSYRIALSTGGLRANSSVGHTASSDEGIFWHTDSSYSIHRTAGSWSSPSYQQLEINWPTGIKIVTSAAGTYTYSYLDVQAQINANHSGDQKIVLTGSSNPYIRFQEGTTNRAYIQYNSTDNALKFQNQESDNFDFFSHDGAGAVNIRLKGSDNDTWGSVYAAENSGSHMVGLLDGDQNWTYRITNDSLHEWLINNGVEMSLSTSTLDLKNNTITNVEDIYLNDRIYHNGDTNTYLQFEANDVFRIVIAGAEVMEWGNNYARLNDNDTLRLGSGSDLRIWHNGSHHYFRNYHHSAGNYYFQGENTGGTNQGILYLQCDTSRTYARLFENSEERLRTTSTGITVYGDVNSTSDIRYKKNVETIDNAVDKVKALRGVTFDWDNEAFEASGEEVQKPSFTDRATGVIAQDVEKVLPEAVREDAETGFKNVSYGNMVGLLIEAIKEQQEQIDMLTQKLNEVENK